MGHALVSASLPGVDRVHKISIIPRGVGALGYTIQRPTEDRFLMTREELENKMAGLLGGRAAELEAFGHLSTGAADDLAKVTEIARSMVARYAMVPELGNVTFEADSDTFLPYAGQPPRRASISNETAHRIDLAIQAIIQASFEKARDILRQNSVLLEEGATLLLERETLGDEELTPLFSRLERNAA
jgi:cell division protease FtsH